MVWKKKDSRQELRMSPKRRVIFPYIRWKKFKKSTVQMSHTTVSTVSNSLLHGSNNVGFLVSKMLKTRIKQPCRLVRFDMDLTVYDNVLSERALQDKNTSSTFSTEAKIGAIYLFERLGHSYQNTQCHNREDQI
jgi:hypothetical protein